MKHHSYDDRQHHGYQAVFQCTFIRASSQGKRPAHSTHDDLPRRNPDRAEFTPWIQSGVWQQRVNIKFVTETESRHPALRDRVMFPSWQQSVGVIHPRCCPDAAVAKPLLAYNCCANEIIGVSFDLRYAHPIAPLRNIIESGQGPSVDG